MKLYEDDWENMITVIIWGTGRIAKKFMDNYYNRMRNYVEVVAFIDNNTIKQEQTFYDCPVISYGMERAYQSDYIVIMNTFIKDIYKQIGKAVENDNRVISSAQFFELLMDRGYWRDKRIIFYGDYMYYDLVEYRARFTFKSIQFLKENEINTAEHWDLFFLCPPRLEAPQIVSEYEDRLRKEVHNQFDIQDENILGVDEWIYYLQCDRKIKAGKRNKDKRFFVIASSDPMQGWGNILLRIWGGVAYANNHQMIPVVDMQNIKNQYLSEKLIRKHNSWEDFFEPLNKYSLDEVYDSQDVVLSGIDTHITGKLEVNSTVYKQDIAHQLQMVYIELFPTDGKVLGVIYRGTDYNRAYRHTASGDLDLYIKYIKKYMSQIRYDYIFLATEVEDATIRFKKEFGNQVFWVEQKRYTASERRWLYSIHFDRENDEFKKGLEYITVLDLLSKCNAIVGTNTGTVRAAIALNQEKYEYVNIIE